LSHLGELELVREAILGCERCELRAQARMPVPLAGPTPSTNGVAVIAEAPGKDEDASGAPLVGRAGQLLQDELGRIGIEWEQTTRLNTCSCYPGDLKTPTDVHIQACSGNRDMQLDLANPHWVLLVGKVALMGTRGDLTLGQARGRPFKMETDGPVFFTTYHPSAALRKFSYLSSMREDLAVFRTMIDAGVTNWTQAVNERCVICGSQFMALDHTGVPWCELHLPEELIAYRDMLLAHGLRLIDKHFPGTTVEASSSS